MKYVFLDGATGTNLMGAGMPQGVCVEKWVLENPDVIKKLQREYVDAGSDIIYSSTFGANPISLGKYSLEDETENMNKALVALSKEAAGGKARVAGDISSTGKLIAPMGDATYEEIKCAYMRQAKALDEGGVDLFVLETFSSLGECLAAFDGVRAVSHKDIMASITVEPSGKTLCGETPESCLVALQARGVVAFGVNCSSGIESMAGVVERLAKVANVPLISKPNAGLPITVNGKNVFPVSSEEFASQYSLLINAGASYIGGCCGTTPSHIRALKKSLEGKEPVENKTTVVYAASDKAVFEITEVAFPERILCDDDMLFSIPEKDEADFFRLYVEKEEDLQNLVEGMTSIETPLILGASSIELFEKAVSVYVGRCIYDSECNFDKKEVEKLKNKYGFIAL